VLLLPPLRAVMESTTNTEGKPSRGKKI